MHADVTSTHSKCFVFILEKKFEESKKKSDYFFIRKFIIFSNVMLKVSHLRVMINNFQLFFQVVFYRLFIIMKHSPIMLFLSFNRPLKLSQLIARAIKVSQSRKS